MSHFFYLHSSLPHPTNSTWLLYPSPLHVWKDGLSLSLRSLPPPLLFGFRFHQPSFRPYDRARLLDIESTEVAAAVASPSLPRRLYSVSRHVSSARASPVALPIGDPAPRPVQPLPPSCSVDRFIAGVCPSRFYPHQPSAPTVDVAACFLLSLSLSFFHLYFSFSVFPSRPLQLLLSLCSSFCLLHLCSIRSSRLHRPLIRDLTFLDTLVHLTSMISLHLSSSVKCESKVLANTRWILHEPCLWICLSPCP